MSRRNNNTIAVTCRINVDYIQQLKSINPAITKRTSSDTVVFRHGALGKYLERLIAEDIERRKKLRQDSLLQQFAPSEGEPT